MAMKSGGPAFPHEVVNNSPVEFHVYGEVIPSGKTGSFHGASLRDYFAAKALSGWLASYPESNCHPVAAGNADEVAKQAYMLADAMLKAREAS